MDWYGGSINLLFISTESEQRLDLSSHRTAKPTLVINMTDAVRVKFTVEVIIRVVIEENN